MLKKEICVLCPQFDFIFIVIFFAFCNVILLFAVCGFFATTYKNATLLDLAFIACALVFLSILLFVALKVQNAKFKELENLKERK